jgi:hypothetical protein
VTDVERLLDALSAGGVDFVVVGGVALTFRASSRLTLDLDLCYSRDRENLRRLSTGLAPIIPERSPSSSAWRRGPAGSVRGL